MRTPSLSALAPPATALLLPVFLSVAGCASPPAWRSASVSPQNPMPTLLAASAFNFEVRTREINLGSGDIGDTFDALGAAIEEDPSIVTNAIADVSNAISGQRAIQASIAQAGPQMHGSITSLLQAQGFELFTDPERANGMMSKPSDQAFAWHAPGTVPNTFGNASERDGLPTPGSMPIWGDESTGDILERLGANGQNEAYASIQGQFVAESGDPADGIYCMLRVFVLDPNEDLLFEVDTRGEASDSVLGAFNSAFAKIQNPVVRS